MWIRLGQPPPFFHGLGIIDELVVNHEPMSLPLSHLDQFVRAEKLFAAEGDSRNELYAKVGRLR